MGRWARRSCVVGVAVAMAPQKGTSEGACRLDARSVALHGSLTDRSLLVCFSGCGTHVVSPALDSCGLFHPAPLAAALVDYQPQDH